MVFSKSFQKTEGKYTAWEEVYLSDEEEGEIEVKAEIENINIMKRCIEEAKEILKEKGLRQYQSDIVRLAIALHRNLGSHTVYHKEAVAKEKFDLNNKGENL